MRRQPSSSWTLRSSHLQRAVVLLVLSSLSLGPAGIRVVLSFGALKDGSFLPLSRGHSSRSVVQGGGRRRWSRAVLRLVVEKDAASVESPALPNMRSEPPERILIHWRGEGVEGYSLQFRHLEFLGAIAAVTDGGEPTLDQLLRGCAPSNDTTSSHLSIGVGSDDSIRAQNDNGTHHALVSFENALSYADGPFQDRVSPVKRDRYEQAMQFVHFHDSPLRTKMTRQLLTKVVERCSLIHAMYEVMADSSSSSFKTDARQTESRVEFENSDDDWNRRERRYEDLTRNALTNGAFADMRVGGENERASWCLRVRQYGDPPVDDSENASGGDGNDSARHQDRIPHLRHAGKKTRSMEKEREALLALRPLLGRLGGKVNLRTPDAKIYVFDGLANGSAMLARRLASGGHRRALSMAPNTRVCVTNTPLCPIAAFSLCNVAGVGGTQTILDPYAGSGAILLAAALIDHRSRTVGIEIAHNGLVNRDDLRLDFATRQLPEPVSLIHGDSTTVEDRLQARSAIGNVPFDLIITDPPYGIRESTIQSVPLFDLLDSIASDRKAGRPLLVKGGKLVCFVPCQEDQTLASVLPTERMLSEAGLRYESIREQPLNSKLSRWLVSFVCYR